MYFCFTEELLRILQRYRSTGKRSHWKVWLRLNRSSRSDGKISRRVTRAVGTQGTSGLTLRLWSDPCLQDVCTVISHTQTLPSDNTWKLPFSLCDCSRVPVDAPLTLFSQPGGFFRHLCVCRFLSPHTLGSLIFLVLWYFCLLEQMQQLSEKYEERQLSLSLPLYICILQSALDCFLQWRTRLLTRQALPLFPEDSNKGLFDVDLKLVSLLYHFYVSSFGSLELQELLWVLTHCPFFRH